MHPLHEVLHRYNMVMLMKQLLFVILVICILLLISCQAEPFTDNTQNTEPPFLDATWQNNTNPPQTETTNAESSSATEERSDIVPPTQEVSSEPTEGATEGMTKNDNEQSAPTETKPKATTPQSTSEIKPKDDETTPSTEATEPPPQNTEETSPPATQPSEPEEPKATAADAGAIATKIVEYLNAYRTEQGSPAATVLPGLTQYAAYRSRQLVTNFAHDTSDERAAATALEYGSYIDPSLYGMTGDPYYTANAREAIAKTDFGGSIDAIAARLARMARNSSSHWSYVGSAQYSYIGVGISYNNGVWYCNIAVTGSNTDAQ